MPFRFNPFTDKLDIVDTMSATGPVVELTPDVGSVVLPDGSGNINVFGSNGIQTSGSGSTLTISDTLVRTGSATTVGATTQTAITVALTAGQTGGFQAIVAAYEAGTPSAGGGQIVGVIARHAAAGAAIVGNPDKIFETDAALNAASFDINVSGNNAIFTVTGVGGLTIDWTVAVFFTTAS